MCFHKKLFKEKVPISGFSSTAKATPGELSLKTPDSFLQTDDIQPIPYGMIHAMTALNID